MSDNPIRVLEILPGNRAIISTEGFCRLVSRETGEPWDEMVELPMAHRLTADGYDIDAVSYANGRTLRFDCEGLSHNRITRHRQLTDAPHLGEKPMKRKERIWRKRKYRVKGFRLGRLLNPEVMAAVILVEPKEGGAA